MTKKKTITCGNCGRKLPLGQAHNSRTCGKGTQPAPEMLAEKMKITNPNLHTVTNPKRTTLADIDIPTEPVPTVAKKIPEEEIEKVTRDTLREALEAEGYQRHPIRVKQAWSVTEPDVDPDLGLAYSFTVEEWTKPTGEKVVRHYDTENIPMVKFLNAIGLKRFTRHLLKLKRYRKQARSTIYYLNADGELHRDGDKPAEINIRPISGSGSGKVYGWNMEWYHHGKRHRDNFPSLIISDGSESWYKEGEFHREGGPAIEDAEGMKQWWVDGERHRTDGPAWIIPPPPVTIKDWTPQDSQYWYVNGVESQNKDLCEIALRQDLTPDRFYELCTHEDYVVRHIAANNPKCPVEWATLVELKG